MELQCYTFLHGNRKIGVAATDEDAAWNIAFHLADRFEPLTKVDVDPSQFRIEGETIH